MHDSFDIQNLRLLASRHLNEAVPNFLGLIAWSVVVPANSQRLGHCRSKQYYRHEGYYEGTGERSSVAEMLHHELPEEVGHGRSQPEAGRRESHDDIEPPAAECEVGHQVRMKKAEQTAADAVHHLRRQKVSRPPLQ